MNSIPLPDELLRKVIGYILPISEYSKYIQCIKGYNDTQLDMTLLCHDCQDMLYEGCASRKLSILDQLTALAVVQKKYLLVVKAFLAKNPLFVRPDHSNHLNENQYLRAFDYQITESNMVRVADNVMMRRGMWEYPDTKREILLYTDTVHLLYEGSIRDLVYSCIVNNVGEFRACVENHFARDFSEIWDHEIICYINKKYSEIDVLSLRGHHFRRDLVRRLIKI